MAKHPKPYFPEKPIKLDYIYYHVGRTLTQYGSAEQGIDACLRMFSTAAPNPLYAKPLSAKRRVTEFKKFLKILNLTEAQRARGRELISEFDRLSKQRKWLAHGHTPTHAIVGETWRKWGGYVSFQMEDRATGKMSWVDPHLSEIEEMGDELLKFSTDIWVWLARDLGASTPKKTEKVIRKIRVRAPRGLPVRK
jgi:hypothetical protein